MSGPSMTSEEKASLLDKTILLSTVIVAALTFAPPLRLGAKITLHALALLGGFNAGFKFDKNTDAIDIALLVIKSLAVVLGLAAMIAAFGPLMIASLAIDLGTQLASFVNAIRKKDTTSPILHLSFALIDGLAIGALVTGAWPFIVAALSIATVTFLGLACYAAYTRKPFEAVCYAILGFMGMAGAIAAAPSADTHPKTSHFDVDNRDGIDDATLTDRHGDEVCTVAPGEIGHCTSPYQDTFNNSYTVVTDAYTECVWDPYYGLDCYYITETATFYESALLFNSGPTNGLQYSPRIDFLPNPPIDSTTVTALAPVATALATIGDHTKPIYSSETRHAY